MKKVNFWRFWFTVALIIVWGVLGSSCRPSQPSTGNSGENISAQTTDNLDENTSAQSSVNLVFPDTPSTFAELIKLFPAHLQGGFTGIYITLTGGGHTSKEALEAIHAYYFVHWVKVNRIYQGRGSEMLPNGQTVSQLYIQMRNTLIANLGMMSMAVTLSGNPGGTNWDVWIQYLMAWM